MIPRTKITGGEAAVEAGIDMIVIAAAGAEAAVGVLAETVEEIDMVMRGVSGVDLMEVPPPPLHVVVEVPKRASLHVGHLHQGEEVLMCAVKKSGLQLQRVLLLVVAALILEAGLLILMIKRC